MTTINKQRKDILLNTATVLAVLAILRFFIQETMMMWFFLFPLQGLITKFFFASKTKTKHGIFIDLKSGIRAKHSLKHFCIPFIAFFLMAFSIITDFIISDNVEGAVSEVLQIICLLLPFITTRSYLYIKKLPLSFLYIFFYHQCKGNTVATQEIEIYQEDSLNIRTRMMLGDKSAFIIRNRLLLGHWDIV